MAAGSVLVSGTQADKPARLVAPGEPVVLLGPPSPFVGRGGRKLEAALDRFPIDVAGPARPRCRSVDRRLHRLPAPARGGPRLRRGRRARAAPSCAAGAPSRHGPGAHQRADPDADGRCAAADPAFEPCPLVVADLSFISLRSVVPALTGAVSTPDADLVLLVKPQFEAGRAAVSRGKGVIRDPALWLGALEGVASALHRRENRHHGSDGFPPDRLRRQRRVPGARPQGHAPRDEAGEAAALLRAAVSEADGLLPPAAPAG